MARRKQAAKKPAKKQLEEAHSSDEEEEEEEIDSQTPGAEPIDSDEDASSSDGSDDDDDDDDEEYDSEAADENGDEDNNNDDEASVEVSDEYEDSDEFEEQGSSDDEEDRLQRQHDLEESDEDVEILDDIDVVDAPRNWPKAAAAGNKRGGDGKNVDAAAPDQDINNPAAAAWMHTDNLSSDDEDDSGTMNRIGQIPLHWYDEYDHIGYDGHGKQVIKDKNSSAGKDLLDQVIDAADNNEANGGGKFTVYDALNARDVTLTPRQIELIRRLQGGAFAHPEHNANPDYIDYFSGVDPMKSGLNSDRYENKSRFQPSKWEKLQVRRLLHRLKCGSINMDYLEGKVRDMNDLVKRSDGEDSDKPFQLWKGDEEDELALRKGPQHMPAPKVPPPGHALSYNPPGEYIPTEEELKEWEEMDPSERPYGHFIPKKFDNLRSVGAYEHAVKERFERCLDLYLCPRAMKRRLNIDPESLVPQLPKASDLRPFPTTKCIEYCVPGKQDETVAVRCLSVSPDGQFLVSGDEAGCVRLWEVQTGRLLKNWDLNSFIDNEEEVSFVLRVVSCKYCANRQTHLTQKSTIDII